MNESISYVQKFYSNKNIFITGGTGFLGIAIVEKILRSCPDVAGIYLLMRPKKGKQIVERLRELTQNENDGFAEGNGELFFKHEPNLSAPGSHTIYAKIPPNLHEHPCECPRWTMPISRLLTEVTGLDSSEADGLPQKICVVCISYLKHAYTFRRQAIDNVAALLAARYLVTRQTNNGSAEKDLDLWTVPLNRL